MRLAIPAMALLLLASTLAPASADIYTLQLPWATGSYGNGGSRTQAIDFGRSFSQINSVTIHWTGSVTAGMAYPLWEEPYVWTGEFMAGFPGQSAYAGTKSLGEATYPDPQSFDIYSGFWLFTNYTWDFLLDGRADLNVEFLPAMQNWEGDGTDIPPSGQLSFASIQVDATPVPEPSGLLMLVPGLLALGGTILRRRR